MSGAGNREAVKTHVETAPRRRGLLLPRGRPAQRRQADGQRRGRRGGLRLADYGLPEFVDAAGNKLTGTLRQPLPFTYANGTPSWAITTSATATSTPPTGASPAATPRPLGRPLNLGNGYTYAASNPWSLVDPFGLAAGGNSNRKDRLARCGAASGSAFGTLVSLFWRPIS